MALLFYAVRASPVLAVLFQPESEVVVSLNPGGSDIKHIMTLPQGKDCPYCADVWCDGIAVCAG